MDISFTSTQTLDKCPLTARPIEQLDSSSSKFKNLENRLLKWLRVKPIFLKAYCFYAIYADFSIYL